MTNVSTVNYDIDGSVMSICEEVTLAEGVTALYFSELGASKPHEIALYIGDTCVEMNYSEEVEEMLGRLGDVTALELLTALLRNLWTTKGAVVA